MLISVMAPLMPTVVVPVLPMFAFARPNVVVLRAPYVHRLLLNPYLGWFATDWYLNTVDDGAAALHTLGGAGADCCASRALPLLVLSAIGLLTAAP